MKIFIDTCAFIALLDYDDNFHTIASDLFLKAVQNNEAFFTSNYVVLETILLLQRNIGLHAVKDFNKLMLPVINIIWVDEKIHETSARNLVEAEKKKISLTDYSSFYIIDTFKMEKVFTFNSYFKNKGYEILK